MKGPRVPNTPIPKAARKRDPIALQVQNTVGAYSARPRMRPQKDRKEQRTRSMREVYFTINDLLPNRTPPQLRTQADGQTSTRKKTERFGNKQWSRVNQRHVAKAERADGNRESHGRRTPYGSCSSCHADQVAPDHSVCTGNLYERIDCFSA
jgi:hypothetical protein